MAEQLEFICITCPVGCSITATVENGELIASEGQSCKRGIAFVREELTDPRRMLTTTVRVEGGTLPLVPVHSSAPLPKGMLMSVAAQLREIIVRAPVAPHQVVLDDVDGTGIAIVTSRAIPVNHKEPAN